MQIADNSGNWKAEFSTENLSGVSHQRVIVAPAGPHHQPTRLQDGITKVYGLVAVMLQNSRKFVESNGDWTNHEYYLMCFYHEQVSILVTIDDLPLFS